MDSDLIRKRIKFAGDVHKELLEAGWDLATATDFVNNIPDADAVEVVHNNCTKKLNGYHTYIKCTCGCEMNVDSYYWNLMNRCPNCGAKMDGGDE